MVRKLESIVEINVSDDDTACNADKDIMESKWETSTSGGESLKDFDLSEPDVELDPFYANAGIKSQIDASLEHERSKRIRKRRHSSLIDKARRAQENQHSVDFKPDVEPQVGPVYIRVSDLSADWSHYISKRVTHRSQGPILVNTSMKTLDAHKSLDVHEPADVRDALDALEAVEVNEAVEAVEVNEAVVSTTSKRHRRKSLIDKAASRQRKEELSLQSKQRKMQAQNQIAIPINLPIPQAPAYCSLCQTRRKGSRCGLCGSHR
jgi:hypothetical protein